MSAFVLSDGHSGPPCVGAFFFFLIPDLPGMRLDALGCALIGLYLMGLMMSMGSLGVVSTTGGCNQSLLG